MSAKPRLTSLARSTVEFFYDLRLSPAPHSRICLSVHLTFFIYCSIPSSQPFLSLLHSFTMPMINNLHISVCRRCADLTKPTLRFPSYASLLPRRHARIPLVAHRTSFTAPSSSKLVVSGELEKFPLGLSDFSNIRQLPGFAYFDKTEYIPVLENGPPVQLVCRPRRFGKSLIVSMLQYFHGFQFRNEYDQLFKVCLSARFACTHHLC